jgi:hypothetical protein
MYRTTLLSIFVENNNVVDPVLIPHACKSSGQWKETSAKLAEWDFDRLVVRHSS